MNVVLEFGRYTDITAYILVANLLTRRIYNQYRERTEKALGENGAPPRPLVITIEEAHKFLNPEVAAQTIFGIIAREMRKYNVTLLVIDQRPSGIDEEVMSQIGTKITCLLDNEKDIDSVLTGVSGKNELKSVWLSLNLAAGPHFWPCCSHASSRQDPRIRFGRFVSRPGAANRSGKPES